MRYVVTSGSVAGHKEGDVVDLDPDGPVNVEALVAAGHVKPAPPPARRATKTAEPDDGDGD